MIKEKFLLAENPPSMPGPGLVISTGWPSWVGKVVQMKTPEQMEEFLSRKPVDRVIDPFVFAKCAGYRIGLLLIGHFDVAPVGVAVVLDNKFYANYDSLVSDMAQFYLENKILKNASYYKKYKDL